MRIPCVLMRGGTSRGPFLLADDLPAEPAARDAVLLAIMGAGHPLQVDGIGGGAPQTSKVAIVSRSTRPRCDVDYLFAQVGIGDRSVDTRPNCGNMLAGVGPFAIEAGLVRAGESATKVRIHNVNTGTNVEAVVQTPGGRVTYDGSTTIPGVPDAAAPIDLLFRDFIGAKTGKLLPTGRPTEAIDGIDVTLVDSAVPMMLVRAGDLGLAPAMPWTVEGDGEALRRIEALRRVAGTRMGLGDVSRSVVPKVGVVGRDDAGRITIAYLMPWQMHKSLAVTGAVCLATAALTAGTVVALEQVQGRKSISLCHPSGVLEVAVQLDGGGRVVAAGVVRTARRLFEGHVLVPSRLFPHSNQHSPTDVQKEHPVHA